MIAFPSFKELILKKKIKFDVMIVVPIINKSFDIKKFQKCIPYANIFNTFTMSEYNGEFPPYTFPIGVGEDNLGILLNDFKTKEQTLIKKPYALVYIQPSPEWGSHARYCFFSYFWCACVFCFFCFFSLDCVLRFCLHLVLLVLLVLVLVSHPTILSLTYLYQQTLSHIHLLELCVPTYNLRQQF